MPAIEPLPAFVARVEAATLDQFPGARCSPAEFARMKDFILSIYRGVRSGGTLADAVGHPIDCIPFEDQPSVRTARAAGHDVQRIAPPAARIQGMPPVDSAPRPPAACPEGMVPFTRITLEELTRYETLEAYQHRGSKMAPPTR